MSPGPAGVPARTFPPPSGALAPLDVTSAWVPSPSGPLAVRVHRPVGASARGAIVLLTDPRERPEGGRSHAQGLACALTEDGYVVLRADLSGTGESAPVRWGAPPAAGRWLDDTLALARCARHGLGHSCVGLAGIGIGALVAALAVGDPAAGRGTTYDSLMLVDPASRGGEAGGRPEPTGGPSVGQAAEDIVSMSGCRWPAGLPADARGLPVLVVSTEGTRPPADVRAYASAVGATPCAAPDPAMEWADGTMGPGAGWGAVRRWYAERRAGAGDAGRGLAPVPPGAADAACSAAAGQDPPTAALASRCTLPGGVSEEFVEVGGVEGTLTAPPGRPVAALLIAAGGREDPSALSVDDWVATARRAAARGVLTLRLDPEERAAVRARHSTVVRAHVAAAEWLAERAGAPTTIVGEGAGGWVALRAAHAAPVARVVTLGQRQWSAAPDQADAGSYDAADAGWWRRWLFAHLPYAVLAHVGASSRTPLPLLDGAVRRGVACDLLFSAPDEARFAQLRGPEVVHALRRGGARLEVDVAGDADSGPDARRPAERAADVVVTRALLDVVPSKDADGAREATHDEARAKPAGRLRSAPSDEHPPPPGEADAARPDRSAARVATA